MNYVFESGTRYGITGANGAGKSTLMKLLSGVLTPSEGQRTYTQNENVLEALDVPLHIAFAAPYIDLIPEMTLQESLNFHCTFKATYLAKEDIAERLLLKGHEGKLIKEFSSGMQQRLKVGLALLTKSAVLLLDEPTSNLDEQGMSWYHELVHEFAQDRLLVVASNVASDFQGIDERIDIQAYK